MGRIILAALAATLVNGACAAAARYDSFNARKTHYVSIDANGDDHQTLPQTISNGGKIAGDIITKKVSSAFVRDNHGDMTEYGTLGGGGKAGQGAFAVSVLDNSNIAGYIIDRKNRYHGFIQEQGDDFDIQINIPGGTNTKLTCMGAAGTSAGTVDLEKGVTDGFYRDFVGNITMFFVENARQTIPLSINRREAIAGVYLSGRVHNGFLRNRSGQVQTFEVVDEKTLAPQDILNLKINARSSIAGSYADKAGTLHGFIRSKSTAITMFDVVGAGTASGQGTVATGINGNGAIVGYFVTGEGVAHGFLRTASGTITTFDPLGASSTYATAINDKGDAVGYYTDGKNKYHGFLRNH